MNKPYSIRQANPEDAPVLAQFRLNMFQDNGDLLDTSEAEKARALFERSILSGLTEGSFVAWVATLGQEAVACGGANFFQKLPTPENPTGRSVYILNMYTLPEHRGQGLAFQIVETIKQYAQSIGLTRVWLDASAYGKPIYAKSGFVEMENVMEIFV